MRPKNKSPKTLKNSPNVKHDLPLLTPLTTLQFGPDAAKRHYIFNRLPIPTALSYEKQLEDIERVTPKGRKYLEDIQQFYEESFSGRFDSKRNTKFDLPFLAKKALSHWQAFLKSWQRVTAFPCPLKFL